MQGKIITEAFADPSLLSSCMPFPQKKKNPKPTSSHKTYLITSKCIILTITTDTREFLIRLRTKPYKMQYLKDKASQFELGISKKCLVR